MEYLNSHGTRQKVVGVPTLSPRENNGALPLSPDLPGIPAKVREALLKAAKSWLKNTEVCDLLLHFRDYNLPVQNDAPLQPPGGSLFLFDRRACRFFRKDGHNWRKKTDGKTVRETHEKLKVGNVDMLNCYYAHANQVDGLQRRCYWLLESEDDIVLVHYLNIGSTSRNAPQNNQLLQPRGLEPPADRPASRLMGQVSNTFAADAVAAQYAQLRHDPMDLRFTITSGLHSVRDAAAFTNSAGVLHVPQSAVLQSQQALAQQQRQNSPQQQQVPQPEQAPEPYMPLLPSMSLDSFFAALDNKGPGRGGDVDLQHGLAPLIPGAPSAALYGFDSLLPGWEPDLSTLHPGEGPVPWQSKKDEELADVPGALPTHLVTHQGSMRIIEPFAGADSMELSPSYNPRHGPGGLVGKPGGGGAGPGGGPGAGQQQQQEHNTPFARFHGFVQNFAATQRPLGPGGGGGAAGGSIFPELPSNITGAGPAGAGGMRMGQQQQQQQQPAGSLMGGGSGGANIVKQEQQQQSPRRSVGAPAGPAPIFQKVKSPFEVALDRQQGPKLASVGANSSGGGPPQIQQPRIPSPSPGLPAMQQQQQQQLQQQHQGGAGVGGVGQLGAIPTGPGDAAVEWTRQYRAQMRNDMEVRRQQAGQAPQRFPSPLPSHQQQQQIPLRPGDYTPQQAHAAGLQMQRPLIGGPGPSGVVAAGAGGPASGLSHAAQLWQQAARGALSLFSHPVAGALQHADDMDVSGPLPQVSTGPPPSSNAMPPPPPQQQQQQQQQMDPRGWDNSNAQLASPFGMPAVQMSYSGGQDFGGAAQQQQQQRPMGNGWQQQQPQQQQQARRRPSMERSRNLTDLDEAMEEVANGVGMRPPPLMPRMESGSDPQPLQKRRSGLLLPSGGSSAGRQQSGALASAMEDDDSGERDGSVRSQQLSHAAQAAQPPSPLTQRPSRGREASADSRRVTWEIVDFTPAWDFTSGGAKMIIVASPMADLAADEMGSLHVKFDEQEVPTQTLRGGVVRCSVPMHSPGTAQLSLTYGDGMSLSRSHLFTYRPPPEPETPSRRIMAGASDRDVQLRLINMLLSGSSAGGGSGSTPGANSPSSSSSIGGGGGGAGSSGNGGNGGGGNDGGGRSPSGNVATGGGSSDSAGPSAAMSAEAIQELEEEFGSLALLEADGREMLLQALLERRIKGLLGRTRSPSVDSSREGEGVLTAFDAGGVGLLHLLAAIGYEWAVEMLLFAGAPVDLRDARGHTPLHWAAAHGRESCVAVLLARGADPCVLASAGATESAPGAPQHGGQHQQPQHLLAPADLAAQSGHDGIAAFLSEAALSKSAMRAANASGELGPPQVLFMQRKRSREMPLPGASPAPAGGAVGAAASAKASAQALQVAYARSDQRKAEREGRWQRDAEERGSDGEQMGWEERGPSGRPMAPGRSRSSFGDGSESGLVMESQQSSRLALSQAVSHVEALAGSEAALSQYERLKGYSVGMRTAPSVSNPRLAHKLARTSSHQRNVPGGLLGALASPLPQAPPPMLPRQPGKPSVPATAW